MSSIVIDLQNEVTRPNCDIVNVLRKAHLIAAKLNLQEFDRWIACELNGYKNGDEVPSYREIRGVLKAFNPYNGWIPTLIPDAELESSICKRHIPNSISEIVLLCSKNKDGLISEFTGEQLEFFNRIFDMSLPMRFALHLSNSAVEDIIEKVKNTVLEWTIKLESEGILGENMVFSDTEKETAKAIPQTVNNYYGNTNVINAPVDHSAVVAGDDNSIQFTYEKAGEAVSDIETSLKTEGVSTEDQETTIEMLKEIKEKVSEKKKPSVIKAALVGLKDYLIGVGASATVALIQAKMQGLF